MEGACSRLSEVEFVFFVEVSGMGFFVEASGWNRPLVNSLWDVCIFVEKISGASSTGKLPWLRFF